MKIKKAVIPAAGLGTRFLPATKAQPKEMLPIVDKPTIQYIVEEAVDAGIESLLIITGRNKRAIEDHFDKSVELELELSGKGKGDLLKIVRDISNMVSVNYIRQKEVKGLGDAVLCARDFIGNQPFAVLLGDDVMVSGKPAIRQLMEVYEEHEKPVVGVMNVDPSQVDKYGIVSPGPSDGALHRVADLVEKPHVGKAPSTLAIMGRYVITPDIFEALEHTRPGSGGEIQLTDALRMLCKKDEMYALELSGERYDVGDKLWFLKATCEFALKREDLKTEFAAYIKELARRLP